MPPSHARVSYFCGAEAAEHQHLGKAGRVAGLAEIDAPEVSDIARRARADEAAAAG